MNDTFQTELFYFTKAEHAIDNLKKQHIKVSHFDKLNDPFDWVSLMGDEKDVRKSIKNLKQDMTKLGGMICMSSSWKSSLMWSHYADQHKGICIGFKVIRPHWDQVNYTQIRPALSHFNVNSITDLQEEHYKKILTTKAKCWSYEREFRRMIYWGQTHEYNNNKFLKFSSFIIPSKIIIGHNSSVSVEELRLACKDIQHKIEIIKARCAFRTFNIVRDQRMKTWI